MPIRPIYLDASGGGKIGLDDFFAAGHDEADLLARASDRLRGPARPADETPALPYFATGRGLMWRRPTQNGEVVTPLTTFAASITADVAEDDGAEVRRSFEITAQLGQRAVSFVIPAAQFPAMAWPVEHLGASAIVYPGLGAKDHARAAIQLLSDQIEERHVFAHLGWRTVGGQRAYLHAGGAIGPHGPLPGVEVRLGDPLVRFVLPDPPDGEALVAAIRASLRVLAVAPRRITAPVQGAVYRAVLGRADFSPHLAGPTGEGKSEMAALAQQHYGPSMTRLNLPGAWSSTGNALEAMAFLAKDALVVVDDYCPSGTANDAQRLHREADRLFRAQGNAAGRQRMRADTSLRPARPPRGTLLSTGEDTPRGQSLRARLFVVEVPRGSINFARLTACQRDAAEGLYAQALAAFVRWVAGRYDQVQAWLKEEITRFREQAGRSAAHRRTPETVANLAAGLRLFLLFAHEHGALTAQEAEAEWTRCWRALGDVAAEQAQHQAASEPTGQFLELLRSAVASGRAHVAGAEGAAPDQPAAWGWRAQQVGLGELARTEWRAEGSRVGWVEEGDVYLDPTAAFGAAQAAGQSVGEPLTITLHTLKRRLRERWLLASIETRGGRDRLEVRRTLQGQRRDVLHLTIGALRGEEVAQVAHDGAGEMGEAPETPPIGPLPWATNGRGAPEVAHGSGPLLAAAVLPGRANGAIGPHGPLPNGADAERSDEMVTVF